MKAKTIYIVIIIALIIFVFLPIQYPTSLSSKGKLLPKQEWILAKGPDGRLITNLTDNKTGINKEFSVTQFQRGDAIRFNLNPELVGGNNIRIGDTIGYVISNEIDKDIEKLKGELATAKASMMVQTSSEKESIIEAEKNKLRFAKTELEEQTKIYTRKKKLFERDLISQQEFEADEARYELARINISIAKERLRTVQSGAKKEEVDFTASQIEAIENEIEVLKKRYESNYILSPINGVVSRSFSSDTMMVIDDIEQKVILIPVNWSDSRKIFVGQKVQISDADFNEIINAQVVSVDNKITTINNANYILVVALSEITSPNFVPGLILDCEINCGEKTLLEIISDYFSTAIL